MHIQMSSRSVWFKIEASVGKIEKIHRKNFNQNLFLSSGHLLEAIVFGDGIKCSKSSVSGQYSRHLVTVEMEVLSSDAIAMASGRMCHSSVFIDHHEYFIYIIIIIHVKHLTKYSETYFIRLSFFDQYSPVGAN